MDSTNFVRTKYKRRTAPVPEEETAESVERSKTVLLIDASSTSLEVKKEKILRA
jgi:hypothetical protein